MSDRVYLSDTVTDGGGRRVGDQVLLRAVVHEVSPRGNCRVVTEDGLVGWACRTYPDTGYGIPWRRYDADDPATWPESGQRCLVTVDPAIGDGPEADIDTWWMTTLAGHHWTDWAEEEVKWWAPAPAPAPCKEDGDE